MPSNPYTLYSLKTLLTTVYHTNDKKYIFKLHKILLYRYISGPFYEKERFSCKSQQTYPKKETTHKSDTIKL